MADSFLVEIQGLTDVGCVREVNEDCFCIQPLENEAHKLCEDKEIQAKSPFLAAVADGMGGAAAGEVASSLVLQTLRDFTLRQGDGLVKATPDALVRHFRQAVLSANQAVFKKAQNEKEKRGMGATLTSFFLHGSVGFISQVGDSRAYIYREGFFEKVTKDQSLVGQLMEMGTISEAQAARHPQRNVILQAMGTKNKVIPDISFLPICNGDIMLLCSDGLSGELSHEQMRSIIHQGVKDGIGLFSLVHHLVAKAKEAGGHDNITAIAMRFVDGFPKRAPGEDPQYLPYPNLQEEKPIKSIYSLLQ